MNKEKLRKFYFPLPEVPIPNAVTEHLVKESWKWHNHLGWQNYHRWENGNLTRGPELDYAWNVLLETAKLFGYEEEAPLA